MNPAELRGLKREPAEALSLMLDTARYGGQRAQDLRAQGATAGEVSWGGTRTANRDTLTGVANRIGVDQRLREEWARAQRYKRPLAVLVLDTDQLRAVNEVQGLPAGDQLLNAIAVRVTTAVREADFVGRIGGDEFLVVCPETPADGAGRVAARLRESVAAAPVAMGLAAVQASVSVGWAAAEGLSDVSEMVSAAHRSLAVAKEQGRVNPPAN